MMMCNNTGIPPTEPELLARFLPHKSYFSSKFMRVKPEAFDPPHPNYDLSVTRHAGRADTAIWGDRRYIECYPGRHVYARADFDASLLPDWGLKLIPSPVETPVGMYQHHADIVGWPQKEMDKAKKMVTMNFLASHSKLLFP